MNIGDLKNVAVGQSNSEYVTVIFQLCDIEERWSYIPETPTAGKWVSSQQDLRDRMQELVQLIKSRTTKNVLDHLEADKSVTKFQDWLKRNQDG
jgi:hypothetical protein